MADEERTHCCRGHEYTEANTWRDKRGYRQCRKCHCMHEKARKKGVKLPAVPNKVKTHCKHGHEFTPANTRISKSTGQRHCRICHRKWTDEFRLRNPVAVKGRWKTHCKRGHDLAVHGKLDKRGCRSCRMCNRIKMAKRRANYTAEELERYKAKVRESNHRRFPEVSRRWHESSKDNDTYLLHLMTWRKGGEEGRLLREHLKRHPELIDAYRRYLKLKRLIRERKEQEHEQPKKGIQHRDAHR